jgi:hypothetical protein
VPSRHEVVRTVERCPLRWVLGSEIDAGEGEIVKMGTRGCVRVAGRAGVRLLGVDPGFAAAQKTEDLGLAGWGAGLGMMW